MHAWVALSVLAATAAAAPLGDRQSGPVVEINDGTVIGSSLAGVDSFRGDPLNQTSTKRSNTYSPSTGIPYAEPPTGTNRLRVPSPLAQPFGTIQATGVPTACPPLVVDESNALAGLASDVVDLALQSPLFQTIAPIGEDCLTINVQRPSTATADSNLPVMFWIFGGGFLLGSTSMYDGTTWIQRSVALDEPIIVSVFDRFPPTWRYLLTNAYSMSL